MEDKAADRRKSDGLCFSLNVNNYVRSIVVYLFGGFEV